VLERNDELTRARLEIDYHGLRTHFTTVNRKQPPRRMDLELEEGPFARLAGRWSFTPLGDEGSRVELTLDYEFEGRALNRVVAPVLGHIMETLVDRFVERAESL
jgi:ribosome-associated toxin RatA of RatAB toxin-antitoxin module